MKLFLDNDIILKLGSLGFLKELESIFQSNSSVIYILSTAIPYIANKRKLRLMYSEETLQNILAIIKTYQKIPNDYIDDKKYLSLADIQNIDAGERVLFSLNPPEKEFLILTGDKRSLEQLSSQLSDSKIIDDLNGKIVCLEYLIVKILELKGIESVVKKMKDHNFGGDVGLELIFNQQTLTTITANEGLMSFYNDLESKTKKLLYLLG